MALVSECSAGWAINVSADLIRNTKVAVHWWHTQYDMIVQMRTHPSINTIASWSHLWYIAVIVVHAVFIANRVPKASIREVESTSHQQSISSPSKPAPTRHLQHSSGQVEEPPKLRRQSAALAFSIISIFINVILRDRKP